MYIIYVIHASTSDYYFLVQHKANATSHMDA